MGRLVITTNVIFTPGKQVHISLNPGIFLPIAALVDEIQWVSQMHLFGPLRLHLNQVQ
jgi:hypothetical protein